MDEAPAAEAALDRSCVGFEIDDFGGSGVGRVHSLFLDIESDAPTWLIAALGRRAARLVAVPVGSCAAAAGRVWVAHDREALRTAPAVDPTRSLLREHELAICAHFGIGERIGRAAEVIDRAEGAVTSRPSP